MNPKSLGKRLKTLLRTLLEKGLKGRVLRFGEEPWGFRLDTDMGKLGCSPASVKCVLDVGANVGRSASTFGRIFPRAIIYSFEPVAATIDELRRNTREWQDRVSVQPYAVTDHDGVVPMTIYDNNEINSLEGTPSPFGAIVEKLEVPCVSLDGWCDRNSIPQIDLLKVDVEGAESKVLRGADRLLRQRAIRFIYLEVKTIGRQKIDGPGVSLIEIADLLEPYGYRLAVLQTDFIIPETLYTNFNALFWSP